MESLPEFDVQKKLFKATGLKIGDEVRDPVLELQGNIYISEAGYVCIRTGEWRGVIWHDGFKKV